MALTRTVAGLIQPLPGAIPAFADYVDPEGAPDARGIKRHHATDWFAKFGSLFVSPEPGRIVEASKATTYSGQVFGGTVKVQTSDGRVWVFRHVDPTPNLRVGMRVAPGAILGTVSRWNDNPSGSHTHIELWKTLAGGYRQENMINPSLFLQTGHASQPSPDPFDPSQNPGGKTNIRGTGITGSIADATGIPQAVGAISSIGDLFGWIGGNWDRILQVGGGGLLLIVGLFLFSKHAGIPTPGMPSRGSAPIGE